MEFRFTEEDERFRAEARVWLEQNRPGAIGADLHDQQQRRDYDLAWQRKLFEGGWAGIAWPVEYGGRGLPAQRQLIWYEEYARAGGSPRNESTYIGLNHGGPTILACGTPGQKAFHLPKILSGETIWCQGFSEPGSGSDLASLSSKAVIEGDHLVVTGSKIWTSYGAIADYQELLVRTSRGERKHDGITWVICDMKSPGIDVRPLANMAGYSEFCEVFYDEVRIPLSNVVGELGKGWSVTLATLSFERGTAAVASQIELAAFLEDLIEAATVGKDGERPIDDGDIASRLAIARAEVSALRAMTYAAVSRTERQAIPGAEASMMRLYYTELVQRVMRIAFDMLGERALDLNSNMDWVTSYLSSYSKTIAGGTSEIQRNIIGERVLGLPRI
jgi:alkylation response protein AidB-like acyl-CoA dehydrogenase